MQAAKAPGLHYGAMPSGARAAASRPRRRTTLSCLLLPLALMAAPAPARAQLTVRQFGPPPQQEIASVGDHITVTVWAQLGGLLPTTNCTYTYLLSSNCSYLANSISVNGVGVPDTDARVTLGAGFLRVTLLTAGPGDLRIALLVRATGDIGSAIEHTATFSAVLVPAQQLRGVPTRIEDERAWLLAAPTLRDATISGAQTAYNFGGGSDVRMANDVAGPQRGVLSFDLTAFSGNANGVVAGRLEIWPTYGGVTGAEVGAYRLRRTWTEGTQSGAPCVGGVTWVAPNCTDSWPSGGDLDAAVRGSTTVYSQTRYVGIDITSLTQDWLGGSRANQGLLLVSTAIPSGQAITFPSRENTSGLAPPARLSIVSAPANAYLEPAVKIVKAEIVPNQVYGSLLGQRFVYSVLPTFDGTSDGINRVHLAIPAGVSVVAVDTLIAHGAPAVRDKDQVLTDGEFEAWPGNGILDVRFAPAVVRTSPPFLVQIILRARTPDVVAPISLPFASLVDQDRLGYPPQPATSGSANGSNADSDSWTVTVVPPGIVAINISPSDTTVARGESVQYRAVARFADGGLREVAGQALWQVAPPSLGSFESGTSVLRTQQEGAGLVTATLGAVTSAPAGIAVKPPRLLSLTVRPGSAAVPVGATRAFSAHGFYTSGDTLVVTTAASWTVGDSAVARLEAPGLLRGRRAGLTDVKAALDGQVSTPANLFVTPPELVVLAVTPGDTSVALGEAVQLHAQGTYTDGSSAQLTAVAGWSSAPAGVVDVGADGRATTLAAGSASVTATLDHVTSAAAHISVGVPRLLALDGTPDTATIPAGTIHHVSSWGTYSDGSVVDRTPVVTWASLEPAVASFIAPGAVLAHAPGVARLTHRLAGVAGDTLRLIVAPALVESLTVTPRSLKLPPGVQFPLTATAHFSDGSTLDLTTLAIWSSDAPAVASVDTLGRATTLTDGTALLQASFGAVHSNACSLKVDTAALDALTIVPADTTLALGQTTRYRALGSVSGSVYDLSHSVSWAVTDSAIATVGPAGLLATRSQGATTVGASLAATAASPASLTVGPPMVVGVDVSPASATVLLGRTKAMQASAKLSNGQQLDVTVQATWQSGAPTVVYLQPGGEALALSLGTASVTATYAGVSSGASALTVLPSVQAEALPVGDVFANPGSPDRLLLSLRLTNSYLQPRTLSALRVSVGGRLAAVLPGKQAAATGQPGGPALDQVFTALRLRLDDGDGVFEPQQDLVLSAGQTVAGSWTASVLTVDLPVGASRRLFVSGDIALQGVSHGDSLNVHLDSSGSLFWSTPTAVVAGSGFPLDSDGIVLVRDLVLGQMAFTPASADTVAPGEGGLPLLVLTAPPDGTRADVLRELRIRQPGTARAGVELSALRVQQLVASAWQDVVSGIGQPVQLVSIGGATWAASGLDLPVPVVGLTLRVVADIALTAESGRTVRAELPARALEFASGRTGPVDGSWANPGSLLVDIAPTLQVRSYAIAAPALPVARTARRLAVLGAELTARGAFPDTLKALLLHHSSTGPSGPAADPDAEIEAAELWRDGDGDGALRSVGASGGDSLLATVRPISGGTIGFGAGASLALRLPVSSPVRLLVALTPDSTRVRDAEQLSVELRTAADVVAGGALAIDLPGLLRTASPPSIDGQSASGYNVAPLPTQLVYAGTHDALVMGLALPPNGVEPDVLTGLLLENAGSATSSDVLTVRLRSDDGDGVPETADPQIAVLQPVGARSWSATNLAIPVPAAPPTRYWLDVDFAQQPQAGVTFAARLPLNAVTMSSANDGPNDHALDGGGPVVVAVADRVTWVAGAAGSHTVPPGAQNQTVLVLEGFNAYLQPQTLTALRVGVLGTAAEAEYEIWSLHGDANRNGVLDPQEAAAPLAIAAPSGGEVRFGGFSHALGPLQQDRLFVAYTLALGRARDASQVDAEITQASDFGYSVTGSQSTVSSGAFPLNSPGVDAVDGHVLAQIGRGIVPSRTLGGGEVNVLTLDAALPSNGLSADTLRELELQVAAGAQDVAAAMGQDVEALRLWAELDAEPKGATFDPDADVLLGSLLGATSPLRFTGLSAAIPPGGRRFYVTADLAPNPTDGRVIQLRVPKLGIEMESGNDGPLDGALDGSAVHRISSSALLAAAEATPSVVSAGQSVQVRVAVRNRGSQQLAGIVPLQVGAAPGQGVSLQQGPLPAALTLAPGASDTIRYRFALGAAGKVGFSARVGLPDSSVISPLATSSPVSVQLPPTALALDPLSTLPVSVDRGQSGVTPLAWQLRHADPDTAGAAPIAVHAFSIAFDDGGGTPVPASSVLDRLEIRTGGLVHAYWDSIPSTSVLAIALDPPVELQPGQLRSLPLSISIAPGATAARFRVRLLDAGAASAIDVNSGQPVPLQATLPWQTSTAYIHTLATHADLAVARTLPGSANLGQLGVPAGRLTFDLPGAAGESEARVVELGFALRDSAGAALAPDAVLGAITVRSGATVLLTTSAFDTAGGAVRLSLAIPKLVTSGAPEPIDLELDLRSDAAPDRFSLVLPDSARCVVRDANTGLDVAVRLGGGEHWPLVQGPLLLQRPAAASRVTCASIAPPSAAAGAVGVGCATLDLHDDDPPGSGAMLLLAASVRVLDDAGAGVVPAQALSAVRLALGDSVIAASLTPPPSGSSVGLALAAPLRLLPGDSLRLQLSVDLKAPATVARLRFALDPGALDLRDANQPARAIALTGLPFATGVLRVVAPATAVSLGVTDDPPANVSRGASAVQLLPLRILHPGGAAQAPLSPAALTVLLRDARAAALPASRLLGAARLLRGTTVIQGQIEGDSLRFALAGLGNLDPGQSHDVMLAIDLLAAPAVEDFRVALQARGLVATSAADTLAVTPLSGAALPWISPTIHVTALDLEQSFSSYPNPFAAGRERAHVAFYLQSDARVTLEVFTASGDRVVRLLEGAPLPAGLQDDPRWAWDGRNEAGRPVRNGVYLLRLKVDGAGGGECLRKLAVVR